MSGKGILVLCGISLSLGTMLGGCGDATPKPRVDIKYVEVPTVKVEKTIETVTVYKPLSDACREVIKSTKLMHQSDSTITSTAADLVAQLDGRGGLIFAKDMTNLNKAVGVARKSSSAITQAVLSKESEVEYLDKMIVQCDKDSAN